MRTPEICEEAEQMICLEGFHLSGSKHIPGIKNMLRTRLLTITPMCCILKKYALPNHHDATPPLLVLKPVESVQLY